jgi:hypothetical protein
VAGGFFGEDSYLDRTEADLGGSGENERGARDGCQHRVGDDHVEPDGRGRRRQFGCADDRAAGDLYLAAVACNGCLDFGGQCGHALGEVGEQIRCQRGLLEVDQQGAGQPVVWR